MKKLMIVESPHKSKTIGAFLGSDYKVLSSKGHIMDLATTGKFGLGVDVENDFKANYIPITGKKKLINELKNEVKKADFVLLATDPDREGEAISWHLKESLGIKEDAYERVTFNEITKSVVLDAIAHPRKIDDNLVKSQETRRILDRIIGFRLSKLMQSKTGGKSAGRVQSVALKLIVDRERKILDFVPEEYWTITAKFSSFEADLEKYKKKKIEIKSEEEADLILSKLSDTFHIEEVDQKETKRNSKPIFKTTTMQQMASSKLNFPSSKTMRIAQKLYEGVELGSEQVGLITYMRTDSERVSPSFVAETKEYIEKNYGKEYVGSVKVSKKKENIQDAHEGIRPTSIQRTPESIKKYLTLEEYKLYEMIYYRALASIMAAAGFINTVVILENHDYYFKATGSVLKFDGYLKVYSKFEDQKDSVLPAFEEYQDGCIVSDSIIKEQHFTKPESRFTEGTLIKEMESLGIGRPSTYAPTIAVLKERDYIKVEEKKLVPTKIGFETTDKLQEFFSNIINVKYTADMETDLDEIAEDKKDNIQVLKNFYNEFEPMVEDAFHHMEKKSAETTGESCPECGNPLVIRKGKYGEFVACSNYPNCKYIKKEEKKDVEIMPCPKCDGTIVERKTKRGKVFYGCNHYPKCDFASWDKPLEKKCPECGGTLVEKKNHIECMSCDYKEE
ncbi:MAG: type I DNA topoisomerase [Bacilli bacterium]|nr:type I DNA topoisomerase [Bacilli bacterium]